MISRPQGTPPTSDPSEVTPSLLSHAEFFAEDGSELILPFGGLRGRGAMKQDPPIVRDLYLSLEDLFYGCTKKIKISRRVGAVGVKGRILGWTLLSERRVGSRA